MKSSCKMVVKRPPWCPRARYLASHSQHVFALNGRWRVGDASLVCSPVVVKRGTVACDGMAETDCVNNMSPTHAKLAATSMTLLEILEKLVTASKPLSRETTNSSLLSSW